MTSFYYKNVYSHIIQQKFSIPANLISSDMSLEIKFAGIENLEDESVLKSFYFFLLIFGSFAFFKNFSSRYHLGKTFYNFSISLKIKAPSFDLFLINFLTEHLSEPNKINFNSSIFHNNLNFSINDLKSFYLVESNPHFFKWEKDLYANFSLSLNSYRLKKINVYVFSLENLKLNKFNNFWNYYVS